MAAMSIRKVIPISEADWRIGPIPSWVESREPDWELDAPEEHGVAFLLADEQHHVPSQAVFARTVRRVLTRAAVQALGQVGIDFDPAAESLRIHDLVIWRRTEEGGWDGRSVAGPEQFLIRQREQQLEQQMLNGRASLVALVEDLRVGDAIDLSWAVEPRDPLEGLRFTAFHGFVWSVPVGVATFTLHLDPEAPLFWTIHGPTDTVSLVHESASGREHWQQVRPPITKFEPNAPPGRWNFPLLEVSAWPDWAAVAEFADRLWAEALEDGVDQIAEAAERLRVPGELAQSVTQAIRFVQEEIRYLNVDFGHGSGLLPNGAGTVLRRRFGDCKDKAVLLTTLLRALGCEAWPFLVNPAWSGALSSLHPSLGAFNHVIVTFVVGGTRYFVDPTFVGQRGDLAYLVPPRYLCGLELRSGATELMAIPSVPAAELTVTETFVLDGKQRNGSVEQVLQATGWLADEVRGAIARSGEAAFFKARAEALQSHFPALEPQPESGEVQEDPHSDSIEVRSRHLLPTWGSKGEKPPPAFRYGAHGLFLAVELVQPPEQRTLPWALRHPMRVKHCVVVSGRCVRRMKSEKYLHSGPGFRYSCDIAHGRKRVTFTYVWETTASEIPAAEWPDYCRERQKALQHAGANVVCSRFLPVQGRNHPVFLILAALGIIAGIFGGMRDSRLRQNRQAELQTVEREVAAASAAAGRGDFSAAEPVLEKYRRFYEKNPNFHLMRAEIAIHLNRPELARQELDTARRMAPENPVSEVLSAMLCRIKGELPEAKAILSQAAIRFPNDARVFRELAVLCGQLGDKSASRDAWSRVLALVPGEPLALVRYSLLLWEEGEREKADAMIAGALAAQPKATAALEGAAGDYFLYTGRMAEAVERIERASSLAPEEPLRALAAVFANLRGGHPNRAAEIASGMIQRFGGQPVTWQAVAAVAAATGDLAKAESACQEWLRLVPRNALAHAKHGQVLQQMGRAAEAREVLARAAAEFPGEGMVWLSYGALLESLGESSAASEAKQKAAALLTDEQRLSVLR